MPVPEFLQEPLTMYEIAEQYWDLNFIPTKYVFSLLAIISEDNLEKEKCLEFTRPEGQEDLLNYTRRPRRTILEVLEDFHKTTSKLTIETLFELFSPIKPRAFSVASSCKQDGGLNLEILVAVVKYFSKMKAPRLGLCSSWLKTLQSGDQIYGWFKNGTFKFPKDVSTPSIMIGPGTGVAPLRSYILERDAVGTASKESLILFFGCRNQAKDFHFKDDFKRLEKDDKLTLVCAFSRDQDEKVYVQHKILENGKLLWELINDKNAIIFLAGNGKNMPDNVKDAFVDVFKQNGGLSEEEAKGKLKNMEKEEMLQIETW